MATSSGDTVRNDDERALWAPFEYIRSMPGKHIRSQLAAAFNDWLHIDEEKLKQIGAIVEMLHNASLLIDDIEDDSVLRRGLPVTHSIFGAPRTINSANYVYFVALESCVKLDHPKAVEIFTHNLLELHRGQGKEIYWRDTVVAPTIDQYEQMVKQKTGGLFNLAVQLMQLFSSCSLDMQRLLDLMALYFQIRDDLLNLCSPDMAAQKTAAEDLTEGKFSFPVIVSLEKSGHKNDDQVLNILRQRTKDVEVKMYCVDLMRKRGAFRETRDRLTDLAGKIRVKVGELGGNDKVLKVMELLEKGINELNI
ncbi:hypothetical protein PFISCL1PPCAC_15091 [Pristionchus fissidentatus]|uniref:Geranylgeranyl pyrophosphate synthase n=1 Tax=Pristionchus fissidentatus TaxID=1538716 RepID=A0AAV5VW53_9BILA|nr:hypothetical protein PFISCL1PPCAC_15091 [Pristionchus fissidentatus]